MINIKVTQMVMFTSDRKFDHVQKTWFIPYLWNVRSGVRGICAMTYIVLLGSAEARAILKGRPKSLKKTPHHSFQTAKIRISSYQRLAEYTGDP